MSLRKVITELSWHTVQKTAFGSAVAICVSTTCQYGVELNTQLTSKASQVYADTKDKLATSWGYELPKIAYIPSTKTKLELVELYATASNLSVDFVLSVMMQESGGQITALSSAGALGLLQIMPATAKQICGITNKDDLLDPETNIRCGVKILKAALVQTNWNIQAALQIYNLGRTCTIGKDCPQETIEHGRLIMARLSQPRETWNKVKG